MLDLRRFLLSIHPYDSLPDADFQRVLTQFIRVPMAQDDVIYAFGAPCEGLYVILDGEVEITTESGEIVSHLDRKSVV
jgi:CBS domain-containing protein